MDISKIAISVDALISKLIEDAFPFDPSVGFVPTPVFSEIEITPHEKLVEEISSSWKTIWFRERWMSGIGPSSTAAELGELKVILRCLAYSLSQYICDLAFELATKYKQQVGFIVSSMPCKPSPDFELLGVLHKRNGFYVTLSKRTQLYDIDFMAELACGIFVPPVEAFPH